LIPSADVPLMTPATIIEDLLTIETAACPLDG
jgi:hypothetical protein